LLGVALPLLESRDKAGGGFSSAVARLLEYVPRNEGGAAASQPGVGGRRPRLLALMRRNP
jgi:hypothetical protein